MGRACRASEEGHKKAKKVFDLRGWSHTYFAGRVGCSRPTESKFFGRKPIDKPIFQAICAELGLDWVEIAEPEVEEEDASVSFPSEIKLEIGLSSKSSDVLKGAIKRLERITNNFSPLSCPKLKLNISTLDYQQAKHVFQRQGQYDIIMLDDPWIPAYWNVDAISPLDSEHNESFFNICLAEHNIKKQSLFGQVFVESLEKVCIYQEKIVGLPILGNVQLFVQRLDVGEKIKRKTGEQLDQSLSNLDLDAFERFYHAAKSSGFIPFGIRDDVDNDAVEIFWEVLRALGHQDDVKNDVVTINKNKAEEAHSWMEQFAPHAHKMRFTDLRSTLLNNSLSIATAIVWPAWVSSALNEQSSDILDKLRLQKFSKHPVMGAWLLVLPNTPAHPDFKEYAIKVLTSLTLDPDSQFLLARRGNIPVLQDFPETEELRQIRFWRDNYFAITSALRSAIPRPRTKHWVAIENALAEQIRNGEFENFKDILIFSD